MSRNRGVDRSATAHRSDNAEVPAKTDGAPRGLGVTRAIREMHAGDSTRVTSVISSGMGQTPQAQAYESLGLLWALYGAGEKARD